MDVKASAKQIRITPRKMRLVADVIRGKDVKEAESILKLIPKAGSPVLLKILKSAVANAVNNNSLAAEKLYVSEIQICDAQRFKRFLPRAKGSASGLVKRCSHVFLTVSERE